MENKQLTAVILGAGHRSLIYGDVSLDKPERLKIVGIADTNPTKLAYAAKRYGVPQNRLYRNVEELAAAGRLADFAINGTMDDQHVKTSLPLLSLGYDLLLEKPFAVNPTELASLYVAAKTHNSRVFVCHVLRYSSFYLGIRRAVAEGKIGKIISINMAEDISYHHMVVSYVRGPWNNDTTGTPLLLAKSCHDIDLMLWLMSGDTPKSVYSLGGDYVFDESKAPVDAGTRCLVDCKREQDCPYSAKKHYLDFKNHHEFYIWERPDMTLAEKLDSLKRDNPYGRCVWKCQHKGVDHQNVTIGFESGAVGVFTLTGGAPRDERRIQIVGTKGSITGTFEENHFLIRCHDEKQAYVEEMVEEHIPALEKHGGGDEALVLDFCDYLSGKTPSLSSSALSDSLNSHLVVFAAEKSRKTGQVIPIDL